MDKLSKLDATICRYYETQKTVSADLIEAILYSINAGGKRIRPLLLLELLEAFGIALTDAHYSVAAALEMIHTGSLIHDDLPAMDNDDYRRGQLTNHKQFDEATAILAGDSLFLDPFGLIAQAGLPPKVALFLIQQLSCCSGTYGMVAGQMLDMKGETKQLTLDELATIHRHKTGALLTFPFIATAIIAELGDDTTADLTRAGEVIGLAFQIRDDVLDVTESFEALGKTPQKDLIAEKATYPSLLGLERSYQLLNESLDEAQAIFQRLHEQEGVNPQAIMTLIEGLRLNA
ncbi:polyprenyl synthetase family protein [Streptococcus phocae subsp. phocae]